MCKITKIPNGHRQPKFWKTSFSSYKFVIRNGSPIRYYKISSLNQWNQKIILMQIFLPGHFKIDSDLLPPCFKRRWRFSSDGRLQANKEQCWQVRHASSSWTRRWLFRADFVLAPKLHEGHRCCGGLDEWEYLQFKKTFLI